MKILNFSGQKKDVCFNLYKQYHSISLDFIGKLALNGNFYKKFAVLYYIHGGGCTSAEFSMRRVTSVSKT